MRNNQYKVHRILMPDGSIFKFENIKNNAEQEMYQGVPKRSLANTTSSAFANSISRKSDLSTENLKKDSVGKASRELDTEVKAPAYGMAAKAEFVNDKVFNKSEALTAIRSINGAQRLKVKEREVLLSKRSLSL